MIEKFAYEGHTMFTNKLGEKSSFIVYHGKDDKNNMVFSHNQLGRYSKKTIWRNCYTPKKIYTTSKGEYVNICGCRFYLKELVNNYKEIHEFID